MHVLPLQCPARYSQRQFPPYRFIPGEHPHPTIDPQGHSYGREMEPSEDFDPRLWYENENYLYGVDLYNYAYWWEAHEALEGLWGNFSRGCLEGNFFQGLIQISAAFIKWHMQERRGVETLYTSGIKYLQSAGEENPFFMGVDLPDHVSRVSRRFHEVLGDTAQWPDPLKDYPFIVLKRD